VLVVQAPTPPIPEVSTDCATNAVCKLRAFLKKREGFTGKGHSSRDHRRQSQKRTYGECERKNLCPVFAYVPHGPLQSLEFMLWTLAPCRIPTVTIVTGFAFGSLLPEQSLSPWCSHIRFASEANLGGGRFSVVPQTLARLPPFERCSALPEKSQL
jgi:hypothetical protein